MAENDVNIQPTKINPIEIKGGIAFSAEHSRIWAEGTDEEVEKLGGEHSAKTWSEISTAVSKEYVDEKMAEAVTIGNQAAQNALNSSKQYTDEEVALEAAARDNAIAGEADLRAAADANLQDQIDAIDISGIEALIPSQASAENQLADKAFVNSSIATATANFIGTFGSVAELRAYSGTVTNNDYAFVSNREVKDNGADWASFAALDLYDKTLLTNFDYAWVVNGANFDLYRFDILTQTWVIRATNIAKESVSLNSAYNRYKATVSGESVSWTWEYTLNNSSFTAAQWAAIQSGITSADVAQISTNATNITSLQTGKQDVLTPGTGIDITNNVISVTQSGVTEWGDISGTLADQTDLQAALNSKLENTATGTDALTIAGTASTTAQAHNVGESSSAAIYGASFGYSAQAATAGTAIGTNASAGNYGTAIGSSNGSSVNTVASGSSSIAVGYNAKATAANAIQIGTGTNSTAGTTKIKDFEILDATGVIPSARIPKGSISAVGGVRADGTTTDIDSNGVIHCLTSVPSNVYTSDNLKAGTNITFITEQEPSGIDENTVALCHLDNSQTNVITMSDMTYSWVWPGYSDTIKKFGDYSGRLATNTGLIRLFYSAASSPFYAKTVDFWVYINEKEAYSTDSPNNYAAFGGLSMDDVSYGFRLKYENDSLNLYATSNPMSSAVTPYYSQTIQEKNWYHLAIEYIYTSHSSSSTPYVFNWYVNGNKVHAQTGSWSYDASFSDNCLSAYNYGTSSTGNICFIDEIRVSDVARYGGNDFVPETAAYGSVVVEVTKVNNTLDTSTFATKTEIANKLQNTATGNHSLTLLGTAATSTYAVNIGESTTTNQYGVSVGYGADAVGQYSVAIGRNAYAGESNKPYATAIGNSSTASGERAIAIGSSSIASATRSIMLGPGTNSASNTFAVGLNSTTYRLLESTGKIPVDRLTAMGGATSSAAGTLGAVPAPTAGDEGKFLKGDGTWGEVADTDLSNLSAAGEEKLDGSWVIGDIALVSSATSIDSGETKTYSLASYLEADKVYEVLVYVYAQTAGTNGARCNIKVNGVLLCANRTNASTGVGLGGASIIPVTNRTISVYNESNYTGELSSVIVAAYRRVK